MRKINRFSDEVSESKKKEQANKEHRTWIDINVDNEELGDHFKEGNGIEETQVNTGKVITKKKRVKAPKKMKEDAKVSEKVPVKSKEQQIQDNIKAAQVSLMETSTKKVKEEEKKLRHEQGSKNVGNKSARKANVNVKEEVAKVKGNSSLRTNGMSIEREVKPETERKKAIFKTKRQRRAAGVSLENRVTVEKREKQKSDKELKMERELAIVESWKLKVKPILYSIIEETNGMPMERRERTFKVPSQKIKPLLLKAIDEVIGEIVVMSSSGISLRNVDEIIYSGQLCYARLTSKRSNRNAIVNEYEEELERDVDQKKSELRKIVHINNKERLTPEEKVLLRRIEVLNRNERSQLKEETKKEVFELEKKLSLLRNRRSYVCSNNKFELNRAAFYREVKEKNGLTAKGAGEVNSKEVFKFWKSVWTKEKVSEDGYQVIIDKVNGEPVVQNPHKCSMEEEQVIAMVKRLPNWKAPGTDLVYNFFIKKFSSLHHIIANRVISMINDPKPIEEWLCEGRTILLDKGGERAPVNMRPITLLNTLFKLYTKVVTELLYEQLHNNQYFDIEQLGTFKATQAAKEQFMFSRALEMKQKKCCKAWLDVKKAYDSVDHEFLVRLIWKLPISDFLKSNLTCIVEDTSTNLILDGKSLGKDEMERGIRQGDSLSPLLFVMVMQAVTNEVNSQTKRRKYSQSGGNSMELNHLLYIDDIKIIAGSAMEVEKVTLSFIKTLGMVGMYVNPKKSASNVEIDPKLEVIENEKFYKYLGVNERVKDCAMAMKRIVIDDIIARTKNLCKENISGKNLFIAINEYAISKLYYFIGPLEWCNANLEEIELSIRKVLINEGVHRFRANKERLYLPREWLGRGLVKPEYQEENILLGLYKYFWEGEDNPRKQAIREMLEKTGSRIVQIPELLKSKMGIQ